MPLPLVAIVGRPNVGKSSLFNRLVQRRVALVEDVPGVTRDRLFARAEWNGVPFQVVDTGGFQRNAENPFAREILPVIEATAQASAVVLFVVDAKSGISADDAHLAERLRRIGRPVLVVANKAEAPETDVTDFYRLGLGDPVPVSAIHGVGTGDLLDAVVAQLDGSTEDSEVENDERMRLALVGRPNVGKSTLMNRLIGDARSLVTDVPGTTTDPVDAVFEAGGKEIVLVDTAGLRRRSRVGERLEALSARRSRDVIERADVVVLVIDATAGLVDQDRTIAALVRDAGRGLVLAVNKWDAVEKGTGTAEAFESALKEAMPDLAYAPVVFISARSGQRLGRLIDRAFAVFGDFSRRIPTARVTRTVEEAFAVTPPPSEKGRRLHAFYATQAGVRPPTFVLFVNDPSLATENYTRYLTGRLREGFGFGLSPIRIVYKERRRESRRPRRLTPPSTP